jgi:transcriptional regulator with XRE-family HTH domain
VRKSRPAEQRQVEPFRSRYRATVGVVADNLKRLRLERGWTQQTLAERAEMSVVGIAIIEAGRSNVTIGSLVQLAVALDVDVADLVRADVAAGAASGPKTRRPRSGVRRRRR